MTWSRMQAEKLKSYSPSGKTRIMAGATAMDTMVAVCSYHFFVQILLRAEILRITVENVGVLEMIQREPSV
jgi:hypothetical protein